MKTSVNQFKKEFEELRKWICASVPVFSDDTPAKKRERILRAREDVFYAAETYFPHYCEDPFAPMHKDMIMHASKTGIGVLMYGFRGCGKSSLVSLIDVVHKILFRSRRFIGFISASEDNAAEYTLPIKAELQFNPRIINDFGDLLEGSTKNRDTDFVTKNGVRVLGLGPKMSPKGRRNAQYRFDHIIIEDIESRTSPNSPRVIKKIISFLLKDAYKAMNPKLFSFIFLGNYFSKKSVLHGLLNHNDCRNWPKVGYPALVEDEKGHLVSAWESRFPTEKLLADYEEMPETERVEMLQKPEGEDGEFDQSWFKMVEYDQVPVGLKVATYCDPAVGKTSLQTSTSKKCFQALIVCGVDEIKGADGKRSDFIYYVLDSSLKKESTMDMVSRHYDFSKKYHSMMDAVEAFGYQQVLINDYEREEVARGERLNIQLDRNPRSKDARITSLQSPIKRAKIVFVNHKGVNDLIGQFLDFPDGFIDGPDALACLIDFMARKILKIKNRVKSKVLGGNGSN